MPKPWTELTEREVRRIRKLAKEGLTHRQLATRFGLRVESVRKIITGKSWKHVQD